MHGFLPVVGSGPGARAASRMGHAMVQDVGTRPGVNQEQQIEIWCSHAVSLLCSVNDAVNVLPCATCAYLNGWFS